MSTHTHICRAIVSLDEVPNLEPRRAKNERSLARFDFGGFMDDDWLAQMFAFQFVPLGQ